MDGDDEADAFESEDAGADGEGVCGGVEEAYAGVDAARGEGGDVKVPDVEQADEDEGVGEGGCGAELGDVANEGERDEEQGLEGDEGRGAERVGAVGDGVEEGEPVVGDEDEPCADEAELRKSDTGEDDGAHAGARDRLANVTITTANSGTAL